MYIFRDTGKTIKENNSEKFSIDDYFSFSPAVTNKFLRESFEFYSENKDFYDLNKKELEKIKKIVSYPIKKINSIEDGNTLFGIDNFGEYLSRAIQNVNYNKNGYIEFSELEKIFNRTAKELNKEIRT